MRYGPWPRSGRLLRHFFFFFLLPARPQSWRMSPCQGGTHCVQWGGRWRPALTWPRRDYIAPPEEEEKAPPQSAAACGYQGPATIMAPAGMAGGQGRGARPRPRCPAAHSPASKRPFVQPRSAATSEGWGGTLPPRCAPAHARASSGTRVRRLSSGTCRAGDCGPLAPKPGGPALDAGARRQYIPNACQEGGKTAEDPGQERHSR
jgi:hypothetical protein